MLNFEGGYTRRLPVYLLLDCSGSMQGSPIRAVEEGLDLIHQLLLNDPRAVDTVYMSVICFADQATQYALTALDSFQPPPLFANGRTSLGGAIQLLIESIEKDLILNSATQHGDYRPLVFLLTDGEPTDTYQDAVRRLHKLDGSRRPTVVALGCGANVKERTLREIADPLRKPGDPDTVFLMHNVSPEKINSFFKWMSGSIARTAQSGGDYRGPGGTVRSEW
jgi:uncharacterized protein YegL